MAPTTLCIVAFTVEIMPSSLSVAAGTIALAGAFGSAPLRQFMDRFRLRTKKASLGRGGFALSVILGAAIATRHVALHRQAIELC
jgi:multisubunit Na+/H+ antiporter MnhG subunit